MLIYLSIYLTSLRWFAGLIGLPGLLVTLGGFEAHFSWSSWVASLPTNLTPVWSGWKTSLLTICTSDWKGRKTFFVFSLLMILNLMVRFILFQKSMYEKEGVWIAVNIWAAGMRFFPQNTVQSAAQVGLTHIGSYWDVSPRRVGAWIVIILHFQQFIWRGHSALQ